MVDNVSFGLRVVVGVVVVDVVDVVIVAVSVVVVWSLMDTWPDGRAPGTFDVEKH